MSSNRGGFHPPMPVVAFPPAGDNCSAGPMRIHACHQCHRAGEHSCRPRLMARWRALLQAPLDGATPIRLFETTQVKCRPSGWPKRQVRTPFHSGSLCMQGCEEAWCSTETMQRNLNSKRRWGGPSRKARRGEPQGLVRKGTLPLPPRPTFCMGSLAVKS